MIVYCPRCRARFQVPEQAAGKKATCSNQQCHAKFVIPNLPATTDVEAAGEVAGGMVPAARPPVGYSLPNPSELTIQLDTSSKRPSSVTVQAAAPSNSMGIVSLVVGVLALLLCWLRDGGDYIAHRLCCQTLITQRWERPDGYGT